MSIDGAKPLLKLGKNIVMKLYLDCFQILRNFLLLLFYIDVYNNHFRGGSWPIDQQQNLAFA